MTDRDETQRYKHNLWGEADGAAVYSVLAEAEKDPHLTQIYRRLAAVEGAHAEFWRSRLNRAVKVSPSSRPGGLAWLAWHFGPGFGLPDCQAQRNAVAGGLPADERSHARLILAAAGGGGVTGPVLAQLEGRHRGGGNALRAPVLSANDDLISMLTLEMGMAGAGAAELRILLTGLAGLVCGACAMAVGQWLSVNTAREPPESLEKEKDEPAPLYQAKGLGEERAKALANRLLSPKSALDRLVREDLGNDPKKLGPFSRLAGNAAIVASLALSGSALAMIGAGASLFTGRGIFFCAVRQLVIGYAAALVTFSIGRIAAVAPG
jgi:VIT1/CCC1 family predicted Fe2+/Mn2+ transporter